LDPKSRYKLSWHIKLTRRIEDIKPQGREETLSRDKDWEKFTLFS
jgi:hypothetical protein